MTEHQLLFQCFLYFVHNDHANAAIHCSEVRYSPLTFRLAEAIDRESPSFKNMLGSPFTILKDVLEHRGAYEEDKGR